MKAEIIKLLTEEFQPTRLNVIDESDQHIGHGASGGHFYVEVVSSKFQGESRISRHKKVYAVLNEYLSSGAIHALSIQALCPEEV